MKRGIKSIHRDYSVGLTSRGNAIGKVLKSAIVCGGLYEREDVSNGAQRSRDFMLALAYGVPSGLTREQTT